MLVTPSGYLVFFIVLIAAFDRRWSVSIFLISVPFYALKVAYFASHAFTYPEIAIIGLALNQIARWALHREIRFPNLTTYRLLFLFWVVCISSVVYLAIDTPTVVVHAYNTGPLDRYVLSQLAFSSNNITQLILRTFFIGSIFLLSINLRESEVQRAILVVVYGSIFLGILGVVYQITQIFLFYEFAEFMTWFGFNFKINASSLGPIPRMHTIAGEPGYAAHFLLYALAIVVTYAVSTEEKTLFSNRHSIILATFLFTFLLLTTSATGYGGLLILVVIFFIFIPVFPQLSSQKVAVCVFGSALLALCTLVAIILFSPNSLGVFAYLGDKLTFRAGSGITRAKYMQLSFDIWRTRPFIGSGVGSHYSTSLLGTLAAETGGIGVGLFFFATFTAFQGAFKLGLQTKQTDNTLSLALGLAGTILISTTLIAKSITALLFPWIWVCVALPIASIINEAGKN